MIFKSFHNFGWTHLIQEVTLVIAFSTEITTIGNLNAFLSNSNYFSLSAS
jgi:hypothetical protein